MRAVFAWIGDWLPPSIYGAIAGKPAESATTAQQPARLPSLMTRLRRAFHSLDDLPDAIPAPWREGPETELLLIEMATIDDIAFAVVAANAEMSAAIHRFSALERLHRLAREAGSLGTDRAVDAALKREGR